MDMHEVIRQRRSELGLSQGDLAAKVGVDRRQIRRYESGETQPTLSVAKAIALALGITIDELAGTETRRIDLSGDWWACWQSWKAGVEAIRTQQIHLRQRGDVIDTAAVTRGAELDDGGYLWRSELRIFDNEALIGWYAADDGAVRSKGSLYYALHPHGVHATGRWVGLSYDGPLVSGWATMARTEDEVKTLMDGLRSVERRSAG
jgi:transcriptional regulator with XRE-family HTH domain